MADRHVPEARQTVNVLFAIYAGEHCAVAGLEDDRTLVIVRMVLRVDEVVAILLDEDCC